MYVKDERQKRLEMGYDIIREAVEALENNLHAEHGGLDYRKVEFLAAAYLMTDYFANELAAYPDDEYIDYMNWKEEQEQLEQTEVEN